MRKILTNSHFDFDSRTNLVLPLIYQIYFENLKKYSHFSHFYKKMDLNA